MSRQGISETSPCTEKKAEVPKRAAMGLVLRLLHYFWQHAVLHKYWSISYLNISQARTVASRSYHFFDLIDWLILYWCNSASALWDDVCRSIDGVVCQCCHTVQGSSKVGLTHQMHTSCCGKDFCSVLDVLWNKDIDTLMLICDISGKVSGSWRKCSSNGCNGIEHHFLPRCVDW